MPQLDPFIFSSITIYSTIVIISLIFIMQSYILPLIASNLKFRNKIFHSTYDFTSDEKTESNSDIGITNLRNSSSNQLNNIMKKL